MSRIAMRVIALSAICWFVAMPGCDSLPNPAEPDDVRPSAVDHTAHAHDDHNHSATGPHQGLLIELGSDEYHAEVVHDDAAGTVTIYLLDAAAKLAVTSDAEEVTINIRKGDQPVQFKLAAKSQEGQGEAAFSEYTLHDKELVQFLDDDSVQAKLAVTINGQPFSGEIPHGDHAEHSHSHP